MTNLQCESDLPYPEIKVLRENLFYASLLKEDYAGISSELTAIMQYMYHSFEIKNWDPELAKCIEKIAIVEMKHLEILAELIILLGDKPVYSYNDFWNSSSVYYGANIINQLKKDLQAEISAIQNYEKHIKIISDPNIKEILERIVLDEELHAIFFQEELKKLKT